MHTVTEVAPSFLQRLRWRLRAWRDRNKPGNLEAHALRELRAAGYDLDGQEDGPNNWMAKNVLELMRVFAKQGHSGASAHFCIDLFWKLARFEPLVPLAGTDEEWQEIAHGKWQNKRCSHVFKDETGAYDIEGIIWREPDGGCYTNFDSRVPVSFPYTPKREYRDRPASNG